MAMLHTKRKNMHSINEGKELQRNWCVSCNKNGKCKRTTATAQKENYH